MLVIGYGYHLWTNAALNELCPNWRFMSVSKPSGCDDADNFFLYQWPPSNPLGTQRVDCDCNTLYQNLEAAGVTNCSAEDLGKQNNPLLHQHIALFYASSNREFSAQTCPTEAPLLQTKPGPMWLFHELLKGSHPVTEMVTGASLRVTKMLEKSVFQEWFESCRNYLWPNTFEPAGSILKVFKKNLVHL